MNIFNEVDRFFLSLNNYIDYNGLFISFAAAFFVVAFIVIISTANSYEAKLIKAIDKFNRYFVNTPQITEDNLLTFNNKMKSKQVPKQLRKQWQQFVLYREKKASEYMSFENCVAAPLRNSTYKRDISVFNIVSWILAILCFFLNLYKSTYEGSIIVTNGDGGLELSRLLQRLLLCPILILLLNYVFTIFFNFRHNAIVDDLYQNYQYFEVNIDKATETLPEYVDYEVLFDKNEIKHGIPILYIYLQRRAEEEKRALETARLKNVEHEKFNFDEAGVESSLVLERAMQEAENYIAERKKLLQDIEQINSEITQEEVNFREITKEYQRQMQVSKESFENFKAQLEDASSTIEANYLKKQQQQELDRQRNLERDYDTSTERHNKLMQNLQEEVNDVEAQIKKAKETLEKGMMSEFGTYSEKVFAAARTVAESREQEKVSTLENDVKQLEAQVADKDRQLNEIYSQNPEYQTMYEQPETVEEPVQEESEVQEEGERPEQSLIDEYEEFDATHPDDGEEYAEAEEEEPTEEYAEEESEEPLEEQTEEEPEESEGEYNSDFAEESYNQEEIDNHEGESDNQDIESQNFTAESNESKRRAGRPRKQPEEVVKVAKPRGRPRKVVAEEKVEPTRGRGRPKKVEAIVEEPAKPKRGRPKKVAEPAPKAEQPKAKRGRPKKVQQEVVVEQETKTKGRGRPKKIETIIEEPAKPKRGRPKKVAEPATKEEQPKAQRGRPKKVTADNTPAPVKAGRGRPKKVETVVEEPAKSKGRGRPKKVVETTSVTEQPKAQRGRPKKVEENKDVKAYEDIGDIDAYLKEIDEQIAKENAKIEESQRELEKNSRIRRKKR